MPPFPFVVSPFVLPPGSSSGVFLSFHHCSMSGRAENTSRTRAKGTSASGMHHSSSVKIRGGAERLPFRLFFEWPVPLKSVRGVLMLFRPIREGSRYVAYAAAGERIHRTAGSEFCLRRVCVLLSLPVTKKEIPRQQGPLKPPPRPRKWCLFARGLQSVRVPSCGSRTECPNLRKRITRFGEQRRS